MTKSQALVQGTCGGATPFSYSAAMATGRHTPIATQTSC
jgi:hypothetical protein